MGILVGLVGSATLLHGSLSLLVTSANIFQPGSMRGSSFRCRRANTLGCGISRADGSHVSAETSRFINFALHHIYQTMAV